VLRHEPGQQHSPVHGAVGGARDLHARVRRRGRRGWPVLIDDASAHHRASLAHGDPRRARSAHEGDAGRLVRDARRSRALLPGARARDSSDERTAMTTQPIEPRMELEQNLHMYRQMAKIRAFEEQVNELYKGAKMPGLAHLY